MVGHGFIDDIGDLFGQRVVAEFLAQSLGHSVINELVDALLVQLVLHQAFQLMLPHPRPVTDHAFHKNPRALVGGHG
jgi:UDP-3-O-acyl-N-acetylglucosamine deacetylase